MRAIVILLLLLSNLGWVAYHWGLSDETPAALEEDRWVRTEDGWERFRTWFPPPPLVRPALSPLVFGAAQLLVSLAALLALAPNGRAAGARFEAEPDDEPVARALACAEPTALQGTD